MPYTHAAQRLVRWPVTVELPADDGHVDKTVISVTYQLLDADEMRKLDALRMADDGTALDAFILARVRDWRDVEDETGQPVPFSADALALCCRNVFFHRALLGGLASVMRGAPAGNS